MIWAACKVDYSFIELVAVQRALRKQRDAMSRDLLLMEERITAIADLADKALREAHRGLDTDCAILDRVIRRHWDLIVARGQSP